MDGMGFMYTLAYMDFEAELAASELWAMTGACAEGRLAFSRVGCDISPAAYTRLCLRVLAAAEDTETLISRVSELRLSAEGFAIEVVKVSPKPMVHSLELCRQLADVVAGAPDLDSPRVRYAVAATQGRCWFGQVMSMACRNWHDSHARPGHFSNSLPVRMARALVNLVAAPGDSLVDPCCGAGTVLIEAALVGVRAEGFDVSWPRVAQSRQNLSYFGLSVPVARADARRLEGRWDAAVADLPYGHTSMADDDLYADIVGNIAARVRRLVVVTGAEKSYLWNQMGLRMLGSARVPTSNVIRHVYLLAGLRKG
ncbi:MAG: hypothetical protein N2512_02990 [Armatimonadetes bacterium]|nr:hypothetical protein [Armatimonadota bacterium]